jgi:hypothetical protein
MGVQVDNKSDSDEFEEDEADEAAEDAENLDVDHLIKSMDRLKRRDARLAEPAWRRLERYREDRYTEELLSDFDDYDLDEGGLMDAAEGLASMDADAETAATASSTPARRRKKRKH